MICDQICRRQPRSYELTKTSKVSSVPRQRSTVGWIRSKWARSKGDQPLELVAGADGMALLEISKCIPSMGTVRVQKSISSLPSVTCLLYVCFRTSRMSLESASIRINVVYRVNQSDKCVLAVWICLGVTSSAMDMDIRYSRYQWTYYTMQLVLSVHSAILP